MYLLDLDEDSDLTLPLLQDLLLLDLILGELVDLRILLLECDLLMDSDLDLLLWPLESDLFLFEPRESDLELLPPGDTDFDLCGYFPIILTGLLDNDLDRDLERLFGRLSGLLEKDLPPLRLFLAILVWLSSSLEDGLDLSLALFTGVLGLTRDLDGGLELWPR